tara:strand:- start:309 stop:1517 length:1209 start_codon:yes stop_codon:yes gene_type:complete
MYNHWPYFITAVIVILFFSSCQNEESLIGSSFLNEGEYTLEKYMGDISILSYSVIDDSVSASSARSLLGSYLDPIFGQTDASFSFQIKLPANNMSFNALSVENIYLNIPYLDVYNHNEVDPNNVEFLISVSQLTENISQLADLDIHETDFSANQITSITKTLSEIQNVNSLNLDLTDSDFGLNEILNLDETDLANNESFVSAFNGFKLEVSPINSIDGGIMYLESTSDSAFLHVEYLNTDGVIDTIDFEIESAQRFNYCKHDYINPEVFEDTTIIFLQALGGTLSNIEIEGITDLKEQQYIAVHNAEMSISIHEDNGSFPLPSALLLMPEDGSEIAVGALDSLDNEYKFNITNLIERIITEGDSATFKLYPTLNSSTADRITLNNTEANPIKLDLFLIKETD